MLDTASFPFPFWNDGWLGMVSVTMSLKFDSLRAFTACLDLFDSEVDVTTLREVQTIFEVLAG
jgi:hypothetical protein